MNESNRHKSPSEDTGKPEEHPPKTRPEPISLGGWRPARILLLDDEPCLQEVITMILQLHFKDYVLVVCGHGDQAWREISRNTPDLLITDYRHCGMTIDEMLHRLYRRPVKFPILVVSGYVSAFPGLRERLRWFPGFTIELLSKPFAVADLKAQVLKCLNSGSPCEAGQEPAP